MQARATRFNELQAIIDKGEAAKQELRELKRLTLREEAEGLGLTAKDIFGPPTPMTNGVRKAIKRRQERVKQRTAPTKKAKPAAKRAHPVKYAWKGQKWSGRGSTARWYTAALKAGVTEAQMMEEAKKLYG